MGQSKEKFHCVESEEGELVDVVMSKNGSIRLTIELVEFCIEYLKVKTSAEPLTAGMVVVVDRVDVGKKQRPKMLSHSGLRTLNFPSVLSSPPAASANF